MTNFPITYRILPMVSDGFQHLLAKHLDGRLDVARHALGAYGPTHLIDLERVVNLVRSLPLTDPRLSTLRDCQSTLGHDVEVAYVPASGGDELSFVASVGAAARNRSYDTSDPSSVLNG